MKTKEQWFDELLGDTLQDALADMDDIEAIQLDAFRAGMELAAEIANRKGVAYDNAGCIIAEQAILTAAKELKEIPE